MVHFFNITTLVYNHTVITQMILDKIVILRIGQCNIASFCKQLDRDSIFIDHITTIVNTGSSTSNLIRSTVFYTVGIIQIKNVFPLSNITKIGKFK